MRHSGKYPSMVSRLRVLAAGPLPPPLGGIAIYFRDLLRSSLPEQVSLQFVQTSTAGRDLNKSGRATLSNIYNAVQDCARFLRAVFRHRPDVCHITTAFGLSFVKNSVCVTLARLFCKRVLLHPRCSLSALYFDRPGWWRWYFRQVIRMTDGVIGLSSEWEQLAQIVPGSRMYRLNNAIDLTPYLALAQERLSSFHPSETVRVFYLGYLGQAKGSLDVLEAAQQIDCTGIEFSFDLVGDELRPGELETLRQGIEKANLHQIVRVHASVTGEEKLAYFRRADIFVYPSYSEGMPMAVIEAMASGLPVVATQVGGLPDLVKNEVNGLLVPPGRPDQLAAALQRMITDTQLRHSMQERSTTLAREQFDIEPHVTKLVEIYAQGF